MQAYLKQALGFSTDILTDEEYDNLHDAIQEGISDLSIAYFTEDGYGQKGWSVVVVKDIGEVGDGKFISWDNLKHLASREAIIAQPDMLDIENRLKLVGLEQLKHRVELVFYLTEY
jgi:hypothetical protein